MTTKKRHLCQDDDFAGCSYQDMIHTAKNVQTYKMERSEHIALIKELGFRLKILHDCVCKF